MTGQAAGGWSTYGSAIGNTVTIALDANGYIGTSSGLGGTVYGGGAEEEGAGSAMNNTVKLESGNVYGAVYGGASVGDEVNGSVGEASGNQVLNERRIQRFASAEGLQEWVPPTTIQ